MRWLPIVPLIVLFACKSEKPASTPADSPADTRCREDTGDDLTTAGRTGLAGAKTGVTTAGEGLKAAGSAGAGLVEGGGGEAKQRWRDGKKDTRATANEGAAETRREAHTPKCSGR